MSPKYLHTNSTSHTWPFSAIAELIDNAYDPDVAAKSLWIDVRYIRSELCFSFTDDGNGMNEGKLHKMLSFGFCEKVEVNGHQPVGHYGNGFKSGSMRLGKDAIVFTKKDKLLAVGFLSQTYLSAINAETVMVPIAVWHKKKSSKYTVDGDASIAAILKFSLFRTELELLNEFKAIKGDHGTRIIIYKLRTDSTGRSEFDFDSDKTDISIPDDSFQPTNIAGPSTSRPNYKKPDRQDDVPSCDYSLRAYCSILYLHPKMKIVLRGKKVKTHLITKSLRQTETDVYRPQFLNSFEFQKPVKITFGFNTKKNHYGVMMYHRNRLIKAYERVGYQTKANEMGVGVVGVIQCNWLQPTHNKQDFDYTKQYRACIAALGNKLNDYWHEKNGLQRTDSTGVIVNQRLPLQPSNLPDQTWVQCDKCLKWRKLADTQDSEGLTDQWFCEMNTDPTYSQCNIPEEPDESDDEDMRPSYEKKVKKQMERERAEKSRRASEEKMRQKMLQERKMAEMEKRLKQQAAQLQAKEREVQQQRQLQIRRQSNAGVVPRRTIEYQEQMERKTQILLTKLEEQRMEMERQQDKLHKETQLVQQHRQQQQQQQGAAQYTQPRGTGIVISKVMTMAPNSGPSTSHRNMNGVITNQVAKRPSTSNIAPVNAAKQIKTEPGLVNNDDDDIIIIGDIQTKPGRRKTCKVNCTQTDPVEIKTTIPSQERVMNLSPLEQQQMLRQQTRELGELRRNVSQLLQVLVPELNLADNDIDPDSNEVDELLKQVLQANSQN
ncbi:MORC family CW-type zinc finger protein 3-like [Glandiceps talaboti]